MKQASQTKRKESKNSFKLDDSIDEMLALAGREMPIDLIRKDGGTQSRAEINQSVVEEYAEAMKEGTPFPPVTTFYDGENYWLADGFHRVEAAIVAGRDSITIRIQQGTRRDAVLHSVGANATHGLRRTNADKRRAVETLLNDEEWAAWSDREIARKCGVGNQLVGHVRDSICVIHTDKKIVARNGTTYIQKTDSIGKSNKETTSPPLSPEPSPPHLDYEEGEQVVIQDRDNADAARNELTGKTGIIDRVGNKYLILKVDGKDVSVTRDEVEKLETASVQLPDKLAFDPHGIPEEREDDHYTPEYVWRLALKCFGVNSFDLDPCSNSHVNPNVKAINHFTIEDNGLTKPWRANYLWLNPPYSETARWVEKLISEYNEANVVNGITLVKGDFSTKWFQPLLEFPVCLVNHRIAFINPKNNGSSAKFASAIVYLGAEVEKFYQTFDTRYSEDGIGIVVQAGMRGVHFAE
ncbi:MAG: hypothetical protein NVS2B14_00040 [Chamaesiphon sp.]